MSYINLIFVVVEVRLGPWGHTGERDGLIYQLDIRCGCGLVGPLGVTQARGEGLSSHQFGIIAKVAVLLARCPTSLRHDCIYYSSVVRKVAANWCIAANVVLHCRIFLFRNPIFDCDNRELWHRPTLRKRCVLLRDALKRHAPSLRSSLVASCRDFRWYPFGVR